jgi:hypothetical protein
MWLKTPAPLLIGRCAPDLGIQSFGEIRITLPDTRLFFFRLVCKTERIPFPDSCDSEPTLRGELLGLLLFDFANEVAPLYETKRISFTTSCTGWTEQQKTR